MKLTSQFTLIILASVVFFAACKSGNEAQPMPSEPDISIARQLLFKVDSTDEIEGSCYRIPALITAPNGDLLAAADQRVASCGDLKWNRDINIVLRRSQDNGVSWLEQEVVVDYPIGQSASDPSFILDKETETIFLFYNYMDLDNEKNVFKFQYVKSTDNGHSWSAAVDITEQITKPFWKYHFKFVTSGRGVQTADGCLLHTLVNLQKGLHLFISRDHGESWELIDTPIRPADESKVIELSDGRWMINSRVKDVGCRYVHISDDQGATWISAPDSNLIDPACNASLIRYSGITQGAEKDILLFSNACSATDRVNMTVKMSEDEGATWAYQRTIYEGSSAYSSMTVTEDGYIGVLYENDNYAEISFARLSLEAIKVGDNRVERKSSVIRQSD